MPVEPISIVLAISAGVKCVHAVLGSSFLTTQKYAKKCVDEGEEDFNRVMIFIQEDGQWYSSRESSSIHWTFSVVSKMQQSVTGQDLSSRKDRQNAIEFRAGAKKLLRTVRQTSNSIKAERLRETGFPKSQVKNWGTSLAPLTTGPGSASLPSGATFSGNIIQGNHAVIQNVTVPAFSSQASSPLGSPNPFQLILNLSPQANVSPSVQDVQGIPNATNTAQEGLSPSSALAQAAQAHTAEPTSSDSPALDQPTLDEVLRVVEDGQSVESMLSTSSYATAPSGADFASIS
ncbi:hypothetical protein PLICRDRAFT_175010 [Plicaturopsis crispa FD-325 SS-3]|nr:hypothetical protein PLICRDRAFT_175010 [Plicaturopsis crispa FD-325 SS-3]